MDPNATLELIDWFIGGKETQLAIQSCVNLHRWFLSGGFEPIWGKYPKATIFFTWWEVTHF